MELILDFLFEWGDFVLDFHFESILEWLYEFVIKFPGV
jgi:hypothetical protein